LSGVATAGAPTPARNAGSVVSTFKTPLLARILSAEASEQRRVVLDLGGPSQTLLQQLGAIGPCRVEIADLVGTGCLALLNAPEFGEDSGEAGIRAILPAAREPLDLILCWDLPNYLNLNVLGQLFAILGERARPGCRLHMLIAYSKREMPAVPARYRYSSDGQLTQTSRDASFTAAPRYSPESLGAAVGDFQYERGVLLSNGMQEFVYTWPRPTDTGRARFRPR